MRTLSITSLAFLLHLSAAGQTDAATVPKTVEEPYQGAWHAEEEQQEAQLWKALSEREPDNAQARYNYFATTRNASLARNEGEVPDTDKKQLTSIASGLKKSAPNSFEAHLAQFHLQFPARAAFAELDAAAAIAPSRTELLGPQVARAMIDGDDGTLLRACKALEERGGVSSALMDVGADLLMSIDPNGVVITNGEMDTYPALIKQRVYGVRKDVLVIDQRLLADAAYRQRAWGRAGATGQTPADGLGFVKGLLNSTTRPVFLALSLDPAWAKALDNELYATGIALRYSHQRVDNMIQLAARWKVMHKNMYAGPLTSNYVLPGVVLLNHYRSIGKETEAARIEHEVRAIAEAQHLTTRLLQLGVLEH